MGTFSGTSGAGNGDYRGELQQAVKAISAYVQTQSVPLSHAVVRLDGQYGNGAIVADRAGLAYVMRGKDCDLLNLPQVQARLAHPPDQQTTHPETGTCRTLFDCPDLQVTPTGPPTRVIVATHPATAAAAPIGTTRGEIVYELFFTALPQEAFTPADVVDLYLHRGAFECVLSDEDQEQDPDRDGSLRVLYAARIGHCRSCPLRERCQESATTIKARRVSAVYWPLSSRSSISGESPPAPGEPSPLPLVPHPVLWGDWQRRAHRRELVKLLARQRVDIRVADTSSPAQPRRLDLSLGHSEHTTDSAGYSAWLAMRHRMPRPLSRSRCLGYPIPLPKRSDSRHSDTTSEFPRLSGSFLGSALRTAQVSMLSFPCQSASSTFSAHDTSLEQLCYALQGSMLDGF